MHTNGLTLSRRAVIVGAVILVLFVVLALVVALLAGVVIGRNAALNSLPVQAATSNPEVTDSPAPERPPAPVATTAPPEEEVYQLGEPFTTGSVTLTIHSVQPVDRVDAVEGEPFLPDPGGQLFLVSTTYSNSKNQVDLSCSGADLLLSFYDTEEREIGQVFDTYRVPGNMGCNDKLLQDTPHAWNFVIQGVQGAVPLAVSVIETEQWLDPVWVDLQP